MSEYEILKSRIGKDAADRAVALRWIEAPIVEVSHQRAFPLNEAEVVATGSAIEGLNQPLKSKASELGQFMTPNRIARFMAGLFSDAFPESVRLLDAGAGRGSLTLAFIERWKDRVPNGRLQSFCYEIDSELLDELRVKIGQEAKGHNIESNVICVDFLKHASEMIRRGNGARYTHAILNPPYKKISSVSDHRSYLRASGLETVNLYSGFVGLAVALMAKGGEVVAIIPRSFCNGPYYRSFREFILSRAAIRQIHLFEARDKAFKGDNVLQENIIIRFECGEQQDEVKISTSADETFSDYRETTHPFSSIVSPDDVAQFIHIPTGDDADLLLDSVFSYGLDELGLSVSTGPVVDFRLKDDLRADPETETVPLLYPGHFTRNGLEWPKRKFKKANAIKYTRSTAKWLFPTGFYTVVRRFSSKEERRRIVASVVEPAVLFPAKMVGFENHLNVFHDQKRPLAEDMARGIATYLNATVVDQYFRRFNGHTQVNASDLRIMRYPSRETLIALGRWARKHPGLSQEAIDMQVTELV